MNSKVIVYDPFQQDVLAHEVDETLFRGGLQKLWKGYAAIAISAATILIVIVGGYEIQRQWEHKKAEDYALHYGSAITLICSESSEEDLANGTAALARLANEAANHSGYRVLVSLQRAAMLAKQGNLTMAIAVWRQIAADTTIPRPYRDAATLLAVLNDLGSATDLSEYTTLLEPLMVDTSPWRFSALEITAVLAMQRKDVAAARTMLARLANDSQAPSGIRSRAGMLLQSLPYTSTK